MIMFPTHNKNGVLRTQTLFLRCLQHRKWQLKLYKQGTRCTVYDFPPSLSFLFPTGLTLHTDMCTMAARNRSSTTLRYLEANAVNCNPSVFVATLTFRLITGLFTLMTLFLHFAVMSQYDIIIIACPLNVTICPAVAQLPIWSHNTLARLSSLYTNPSLGRWARSAASKHTSSSSSSASGVGVAVIVSIGVAVGVGMDPTGFTDDGGSCGRGERVGNQPDGISTSVPHKQIRSKSLHGLLSRCTQFLPLLQGLLGVQKISDEAQRHKTSVMEQAPPWMLRQMEPESHRDTRLHDFCLLERNGKDRGGALTEDVNAKCEQIITFRSNSAESERLNVFGLIFI